jgi:hypothetical protein
LGTERTNVDAVVPAVPGVPDENGQVCNAETGGLANRETAKPQISRWLGARCARSQRAWGSEKSLHHDYKEWYQKYNQPPYSRELFCTILNQWFQPDAEGWQGFCLGADWSLSDSNRGNPSYVRHSGTGRIQ